MDRNQSATKQASGVFCAPWCGFKCTHAAHDRAQKEARELCEILGEGWEPRVWENCGWNYDVRRGAITMHAWRTGGSISADWTVTGYSAEFRSEAGQIWPKPSQETPQKALAFTLAEVRSQMHNMATALQSCE